jgi:hypothetical protein
MRPRPLPIIGTATVALVALWSTHSGSASAHSSELAPSYGHTVVSASHGAVEPALTTCHVQDDSDNGVGIVSQNFEPAFNDYDTKAADDFRGCSMVAQVVVSGLYFSGSGPCRSMRLTFYTNQGGRPKLVIPGANINNVPYTDIDGLGSFIITPTSAISVPGGHRWMAVICNMDFSTGGEWSWLTNNIIRIDPSHWRNPGGGFDTGCTKYGVTTTCIAASEGGDFAFDLYSP